MKFHGFHPPYIHISRALRPRYRPSIFACSANKSRDNSCSRVLISARGTNNTLFELREWFRSCVMFFSRSRGVDRTTVVEFINIRTCRTRAPNECKREFCKGDKNTNKVLRRAWNKRYDVNSYPPTRMFGLWVAFFRRRSADRRRICVSRLIDNNFRRNLPSDVLEEWIFLPVSRIIHPGTSYTLFSRNFRIDPMNAERTFFRYLGTSWEKRRDPPLPLATFLYLTFKTLAAINGRFCSIYTVIAVSYETFEPIEN